MTVQITIADDLYSRANEIAAQENVSLEELVASVLDQHILQIERLKQRAARGSLEKFLRVMDKVPDVDPPTYDKLE